MGYLTYLTTFFFFFYKNSDVYHKEFKSFWVIEVSF